MVQTVKEDTLTNIVQTVKGDTDTHIQTQIQQADLINLLLSLRRESKLEI